MPARWGSEVLSDEGVNREAVAEIVFERPDELAWLEGELSPAWGQRIGGLAGGAGESGGRARGRSGREVPLLFEAGVDGAFDATIAVVADEEIREERAGARDHRVADARRASSRRRRRPAAPTMSCETTARSRSSKQRWRVLPSAESVVEQARQ